MPFAGAFHDEIQSEPIILRPLHVHDRNGLAKQLCRKRKLQLIPDRR